jgi:membrane protein insertase Oxa1/YidC/SpoIIIJ
MALYKREKYSMFSACLPTIVTLVLIIVMFAGFRELTGWKFASDYQDCYKVYDQSMTAQLGEDWENYQGNGEVYASAKENAQQAVFDFYYADEQVESRSFLWIKNIFSPDSWSKAVPDYETVSGQSGGYSTRITGVTADEYESVMGKLIGQGGWGKNGSWNGWLLLPFFTLVLGIVSQKLLAVTQGTGEKKEKKSFKEKWENLKNLGQPKEGQEPNAQDQSQASMKMMQYMMPLISAVFALMYSSAFALYMVVNSFVSTLIQLIFNLAFMIADKREKEGLSKPSKVKAKK